MVGLVSLLTGCGPAVDPLASSPTAGSAPVSTAVVVGSAGSTESRVLAALYAQALAAKGVPASAQVVPGSREASLRALADGSVSLVPGYTGQLLRHYDENATATTRAEVDDALPEALPSDLALGTPSEAANQDTYVVTGPFSRRYGVTSLADLRVRGPLVVGGPRGLANQPFGPQALQQIYGVRLKQFKPTATAAARARDLDAGRIQVGEFSGTDAAVTGRGYVALVDPQAMILPQDVVPLMRSELAGNPTVTSALDAVQSALTTADLAALDQRVDVAGDDPGRVAADWLAGKGLV